MMLDADIGYPEREGPRNRDIWTRVKLRLKADLGEEVFSCWFAGMNLEEISASAVTLSVPSRFLKSWISTHYRDKLASLWQSETDTPRKIDVIVRSAIRQRSEPAKLLPAALSPSEPASSPAPEAVRAENAPPPTLIEECSSPLDPRYTFATFVEGTANRFALAAARQVAEGASAGMKFNPLYLYSAVGLGKTHLLQAIVQEMKTRRDGLRVLYLTAEHFMYRFVHALQTHSAMAFKEALRGIDVFLIDDMQFLQGKQVQQEFCHTVNSLIDGARQVVVAADRTPAELDTLDERVRSRLASGLLVEITPPDLALRRAIVERRIEAVRLRMPEFSVPAEVIDFIVRNIATNGRDLEGALTRLIGHNQLTGLPISLTVAETTLRDLVRAIDTRRVKIEDIQRIVAKHYNVSKQDLLSSRRTRAIVWPRQIAMYLSKCLTPRSLPEIGRRFGGRDHTTVLHAVRKVDELLADHPTLAEEIETLKRMLDA